MCQAAMPQGAMGVVDCGLLFSPETDLHAPTGTYKMISAMRRPTWLQVQEDVREAVAANSETRVGPYPEEEHCEGDGRGQA